MRILHVMTDADIGGAEVLVEAHGRYHDPADTYAVAVLLGRGSLSDRLESVYEHVTYLDFDPASRDLLGMVRKLRGVVRDFEPDIVHSHLFHADLVSVLAPSRAAKVTTMHTQGFGPGVHRLTPVIARTVARLSHFFDAVVPIDESTEQFARSMGYRHLVAPIDNIAQLATDPVYAPTGRRLLSLARWHPVKGHEQLFNASGPVLRESGWSLDCVGPDMDEKNAELLAAIDRAGVRDLLDGGRIRLHGAASIVGEYLAHAAALVISSTYGEARPIVGIEALGYAVPVISTDVGGCASYVLDPRLLARPGEPADLRRALSAFVSMTDDEHADLSRRSRELAVEGFGPKAAIDAYRGVYRQAMRDRAGRPWTSVATKLSTLLARDRGGNR